MKKSLLLICTFLYSLSGFSQIWPKLYSAGTYDRADGVFESYDRGIIIGGTSLWPSITAHMWLIKTDINGDTLWTKIIQEGDIRRILPTSDKGILIVGNATCGTLNYVPIAIKLNVCGELEWCTYLSTPTPSTYPISVVECSDNTYAVLCNYVVNSKSTIFKLDSFGQILWQQGFYQPYLDVSTSLYQTNDKGFLLTGYGTSTSGIYDGTILIKTDSLGQNFSVIAVNSLFGQSGVSARNAMQTIDDGYLVLATGSTGNRLYKLDSNFQPLWTKNYPITDCRPHFIIAETDSTFIAPFTHYYGGPSTGNSDYYKIFRFDYWGDTITTATYNNPIIGNPYLSYIYSSITSDDKIILAGVSSLVAPTLVYHLSVLKLTSTLDIDSSINNTLVYDSLCDVPIVSGIIKLNCSCPVVSTGIIESNDSSHIVVSPNPSDNFIRIQSSHDMLNSIKLFNLFGQLVLERNSINSNSIEIDITTISNGMYYLDVESDSGIKKFRQMVIGQ